MVRDLDFSLFTIEEFELHYKLTQKHERLVEERARELRFYPELGLSDNERNATLRCMTYNELKPIRTIETLYKKIERITKELSKEELEDVRIYSNITIHFSEYGPKFSKLDDENVYIWTEIYSRIMERHDFPTFEKPYSFLTKQEQERVLEAGSKLDPKELEEIFEKGGGGLKGTNLSPEGETLNG
jgi:hypothetical protein